MTERLGRVADMTCSHHHTPPIAFSYPSLPPKKRLEEPVVMKYGIKLPGEEVFELLLAAKEAMAHQMDCLTLPYTHTHTLLQLQDLAVYLIPSMAASLSRDCAFFRLNFQILC